MSLPIVFADFMNDDPKGRLRLCCVGTIQDLSRLGVVLRDGLRLILSDRELWVEGEVQFAPEEHGWVAVIDWDAIQPLEADPAGQTPAACPERGRGMPPTIYADFHNADRAGRLRLDSNGTLDDLKRTGLVLSEGMHLTLADETLVVEGVVQFSQEENLWVAVIDWDAIRDLPATAG